MGDPAQADPAAIVDFPYHNDRAHWPNKHDVYPIKGNYMLMVDNLMDLTHLGYLHAKTVGGNPAQHVEAEMKTERTPTGLKFTRWMRTRCRRRAMSGRPGSRAGSTAARRSSSSRRARSCNGPARPMPASGTATRDDFRFQFRLFHGLTPETETSCFYFWSAANGYRQNEPEATEQLYREIAPTFVEDKDMVEAQQARLDEFGEDGPGRHRHRRQPHAHAPHGRAADRRGARGAGGGVGGSTGDACVRSSLP